jgi:hypothetical protein
MCSVTVLFCFLANSTMKHLETPHYLQQAVIQKVIRAFKVIKKTCDFTHQISIGREIEGDWSKMLHWKERWIKKF